MSRNPLILQGFEWYLECHDESQYSRLNRLLSTFSTLGITSLWLPPGCKANNSKGNGYDIYDLWDLGEFEQKGSRGTKWGNREELDDLIKKAKELEIDIVWDTVINHKTAGDATEEAWAVEVDKEDRRYEICPPKKIEAWLRYDFHGRRQDDGSLKYSQSKWRAEHFNGTDWDHRERKNAIYKLIDDPATLAKPFVQPQRPQTTRQDSTPKSARRLSTLIRRFSSESSKTTKVKSGPARRTGKGWADDVDKEHGNNDYLMFSNIDYTHPEVCKEVKNWGEWMVNEVGVHGFRLDAVQHFSFNFTKEWIQHMNTAFKGRPTSEKDVFVVGEVWSGDRSRITTWLDAVQHSSGRPQVFAFDAPLLYNFSRISEDMRRRSKNLDLRTILRGSLLTSRPNAAVTLVTNHDTQPGQICYTPMPAHLKLLWYAFILLRAEGMPCVFWGDLFGTQGPHAEAPIRVKGKDSEAASGLYSPALAKLMLCRKLFARGEQTDYWQSAQAIGWTRAGDEEGDGCAVVLSAAASQKSVSTIDMRIGRSGEGWIDALGHAKEGAVIDSNGVGVFRVVEAGVSVWIKKGNEERL